MARIPVIEDHSPSVRVRVRDEPTAEPFTADMLLAAVNETLAVRRHDLAPPR